LRYIVLPLRGVCQVKYRGNPWAVLLVLSLGFFMTLLDLTIVNIAIPDMMRRLNASLDDVLWVLNAYALVLAVLVITAGRLGDLFGPKKLFVWGIALFTVASAACGLAPDAAFLIGFRAVQGIGAAMLLPQTLALITIIFPADRRGAAMGIWGAVAGVATIAGPTLGGLLVTELDWRWIFFVNLPIGVIVFAAALVIIPDIKPGRRHQLDLPGVAIATVALLGICYGLVEGQSYDWDARIWVSIGIGIVMVVVFLLYQRSRQGNEPLVPFALFASRNFSIMNIVAGTLAIGMLGIFLPFTIYLQSALGFSALKAGLTFAPSSIVMIPAAPLSGRLTDRIGGKYILMAGLTLFAGGMGWAVLVATPTSTWLDFLAPMIVAGFGMGCVFPPMTTTAMRDVDPKLAGAASGMLNTVRQVGSVIGTASVGALLQNRLASSLTAEATRRSVVLPEHVRHAFIGAFAQAASFTTGTSSRITLPKGTPAALAAELTKLGAQVFSVGYVQAMRWTMVLPISVIALAALSCLAIRGRSQAPVGTPDLQPAAASTPGRED
jgi:EmrB/QacA subfamily drug resistance transporter